MAAKAASRTNKSKKTTHSAEKSTAKAASRASDYTVPKIIGLGWR